MRGRLLCMNAASQHCCTASRRRGGVAGSIPRRRRRALLRARCALSAGADAVTCAALYLASDMGAQMLRNADEPALEAASSVCVRRVGRYAAFGLLDGCVSHYWFSALDDALPAPLLPPTVVPSDGSALPPAIMDAVLVAEKVVADLVCFTPLWCAAFLFCMEAMRSGFRQTTIGFGAGLAAARVKADWFELYTGNVAAWLPINALIYGVVPLQRRVLAFSVATLLYTLVLSAWDAAKAERTTVATKLGLTDADKGDPSL